MSQSDKGQVPCLSRTSLLTPQCGNGRDSSHASFADLYRREKPRLLRFFFRKLGNKAEADDLAQETLARFFKATGRIDVATPEAYLTRIATNMLRDRAALGATALARACVPLDDGIEIADPFDPHRTAAGRQSIARWQRILSGLPPLTLDIFLLNRVEGHSYRDIASIKDLPLWAVQKHMLKAIRHIAANQEADDD